MISITDNSVLITVGGACLLQRHHPETHKTFNNKQECFDWVVESGWFDRCKAAAIRLLKENTTQEIETQIPLFKQVNAALGIYSPNKCRQIKKTVQALLNELNAKEQAFLHATTLAEFLELWDRQHPRYYHLQTLRQKTKTTK